MKGSIRKRGKDSWELTIEGGRDTQGRRQRKFINVKGKRADAERHLRELLTAADRGIPINTQNITVAQWVERWLRDHVAPNCRTRTREGYEGIMAKHVLPNIGHLQLTKLTPSHIKALEAKLSAQGMAPAGVTLAHNVLSGALKQAVRMELLWRNPSQAVTPPKVVRKEVEPPEVTVVRRILDIAKAEERPLFPCLYLIAYTGMRRGEALGLRWQDVDFELGAISIVQTLGRSLKGLIFQPPKTQAGRRTIELDASTIAILRVHQGQQLLHRAQLEGAYQDYDLVFANPTGGPMNPMGLTRAFQALAKRAGFIDANLHDLRHFHASVLLQRGQNPGLVSKRLGHASIATTMDIYGHVLPGWQKEASEAFAKAMEQD